MLPKQARARLASPVSIRKRATKIHPERLASDASVSKLVPQPEPQPHRTTHKSISQKNAEHSLPHRLFSISDFIRARERAITTQQTHNRRVDPEHRIVTPPIPRGYQNAQLHTSSTVSWDLLMTIMSPPVCWLLRAAPLQRQTSVLGLLTAAFCTDVVVHRTITSQASDSIEFLGLGSEEWIALVAPLAEVAFASIAIILTIVSLILQLSATRYNPHVVALFFRDEPSRAIMHFFVGTAIICLWINMALLQSDNRFLPRVACSVLMFCITASTLLVIPFFEYVFEFIDPKNCINIMRSSAILHAGRTGTYESRCCCRLRRIDGEYFHKRVRTLVRDCQKIEEYTLAAVNNKDVALIFHGIDSLGVLVLHAMRYAYAVKTNEASSENDDLEQALLKASSRSKSIKSESMSLPRVNRTTEEDPLYAEHLHEVHKQEIRVLPAFEALNDINREKYFHGSLWLQKLILYSMKNIFFCGAESVNTDVCAQVLACLLAIGLESIIHQDLQSIDLSLKSLNTCMRICINKKNIKLCCNVLNHYRKFVYMAMFHPSLSRAVLAAFSYLQYYAHSCYTCKLYFVTEVVAYDMASCLETAHDLQLDYQEKLLLNFLEVDDVPQAKETDEQGVDTLRGVRKAQMCLATYYLLKGDTSLAILVRGDMSAEPEERLYRIVRELVSVNADDFWEEEDRGFRIDFLTQNRKELLHAFLALPIKVEADDNDDSSLSPSKEQVQEKLKVKGRRIGHNMRMNFLRRAVLAGSLSPGGVTPTPPRRLPSLNSSSSSTPPKAMTSVADVATAAVAAVRGESTSAGLFPAVIGKSRMNYRRGSIDTDLQSLASR